MFKKAKGGLDEAFCLNEDNVSANLNKRKPTDYIICKRFNSNPRTPDRM